MPAASLSALPAARQSSSAGVVSRLHTSWLSRAREHMGGLCLLVILQLSAFVWLRDEQFSIFTAPSLPHLLLLLQCASLVACALYAWQAIVFHLSWYSSKCAAGRRLNTPDSVSTPRRIHPVTHDHSPQDVPDVPSKAEVAASSSVCAVAPESARVPAAVKVSSSAAAADPSRTGALCASASSGVLRPLAGWPLAVQKVVARCVCCGEKSPLRYVPLLWKTHWGGGATAFIENSHVLITGGSKGIGLCLGTECVRRGAALVTLVARTASDLEQAQKRCLLEAEASGRNVAIQTLQVDVAAVDTVQEDLHRAMRLEGKIAYAGTATYTSVVAAVALPVPQGASGALRSASGAEKQQQQQQRQQQRQQQQKGGPNESDIPPATDARGRLQREDLQRDELQHEKTDPSSDGLLCPPRVLFCNAALPFPATLEAMSPSLVRRMVDTNLTSVLLQVQAVLPYMRQQQSGCICFSNTLAAQVPIYGFSVYAGTKAALTALSTVLEQETAGTNIRFVNAYMPSVATPGFAEEKRIRPALTGQLEEMASVLRAEAVATRILDAIEEGKRQVTFGVDGWLLARAAAAFDAADALSAFLFEVFLAGIVRAGLLGLRVFYQLVCFDHATKEGDMNAEKRKSENSSE